MADIVHAVIRLLLLSLVRTGVGEEDGQTVALPRYKIKHPCGQVVVCFHVWQLSTEATHDYIAIVRDGEIQAASVLENKDSQCMLKINNPTEKDVGRHYCKRRLNFLSYNTSPQLNLTPGKTVSLQCVLLTYIQQGLCYTQQQRHIKLMWVDEDGKEIQEDAQHHIKQESTCDTTLTVTCLSPINTKFRCQATVDDQVLTSQEFHVQVLAPRGRGRGYIKEQGSELENPGDSQDTVGLSVGLVGCAVLSVLVAAFAVNKRRKSQQLLKESSHTVSGNNVVNADDVIYAEIMLPAGSERVLVHECESTEYACVRYN
ncbi:uncharacterized protein LOC121521652 [Cheilinus undulatus]|uniref:uncharacterized protein LOC121521652 n=1 Tax=Cheilinus undulatus TaxID=241271 RepID=UPI001BD6D610|nr:uncharacterized protein LOC121521652 [Cheilinus undulatus]